MKKQYTPGPWKLENIGFTYRIECEDKSREDFPDINIIALLDSCISSEEQMANFTIMKSAPALVEALERLCGDINDLDLCCAPDYAIAALALALTP